MQQSGRSVVAALVVAAALLLTTVAHAVESVSSARLADRCRAYIQNPIGDDGRFCTAYVRGFIDGSPTVVIRAAAGDSMESFLQRAVRTRLGRPWAPRTEYCIDGSLGMRELVEQIVTVADETVPRDDVPASVLLCATFARFHKCSS